MATTCDHQCSSCSSAEGCQDKERTERTAQNTGKIKSVIGVVGGKGGVGKSLVTSLLAIQARKARISNCGVRCRYYRTIHSEDLRCSWLCPNRG